MSDAGHPLERQDLSSKDAATRPFLIASHGQVRCLTPDMALGDTLRLGGLNRPDYTRCVIRAHHLSKRFGDKRVLDGLDLEVPRGGFVLVTGPNGSGKTTLLRLCAGLAAPTGGELDVGVFYWLGVAGVAALLLYEHSLVRPGDLRRLDTAFFTMNGVISVGFFAFVLADSL